MVRTLASHAGNRGSSPRGTTNNKYMGLRLGCPMIDPLLEGNRLFVENEFNHNLKYYSDIAHA